MLARSVPGLMCLTDYPAIAGVEIRPLLSRWPGWWAKMEAYGPMVQGDMLLMDLDTVVLEMPAMPSQTTVLRDWLEPSVMNSSWVFATEQDRMRVWNRFVSDPGRHMAANNAWPNWGDQGFLQGVIGGRAKWGEEIRSYKVHCQDGVPAGTKVVCFHGKPRPWDLKEPLRVA